MQKLALQRQVSSIYRIFFERKTPASSLAPVAAYRFAARGPDFVLRDDRRHAFFAAFLSATWSVAREIRMKSHTRQEKCTNLANKRAKSSDKGECEEQAERPR